MGVADGAFSHKGLNAFYCVVFLIDLFTNTVFMVNVVMQKLTSCLQPVAYEIVSKDDFEGPSGSMEGEAAYRLAERLYREGKTVECIIADRDGTTNNHNIELIFLDNRCNF